MNKLAATRGRTPEWIMREAIQQCVEREEARESFKAEALASWQAYQQSGSHLTGPEASQWLESWGSNTETWLPECHT